MTLFINTTNLRLAEIVLISPKSIYRSEISNNRDLSKKLLPAISKLLYKRGVKLEDLSKIIVAVGPGAFSSTRTGIATALGLSFSLKIRLLGIKIQNLPENFRFLDKSTKLESKITPIYDGKPNITRAKPSKLL